MPAEFAFRGRKFIRDGSDITLSNRERNFIEGRLDSFKPYVDETYDENGYYEGTISRKDGTQTVRCKSHRQALFLADVLENTGLTEETGENPSRNAIRHVNVLYKRSYRGKHQYRGNGDEEPPGHKAV